LGKKKNKKFLVKSLDKVACPWYNIIRARSGRGADFVKGFFDISSKKNLAISGEIRLTF